MVLDFEFAFGVLVVLTETLGAEFFVVDLEDFVSEINLSFDLGAVVFVFVFFFSSFIELEVFVS